MKWIRSSATGFAKVLNRSKDFLKKIWNQERLLILAVSILSCFGLLISTGLYYQANKISNDGIIFIAKQIRGVIFMSKADDISIINHFPEQYFPDKLMLLKQGAEDYLQMKGQYFINKEIENNLITSTGAYYNFVTSTAADKNLSEVVEMVKNYDKLNTNQNLLFLMLSISQILNILFSTRLTVLSIKVKKLN